MVTNTDMNTNDLINMVLTKTGPIRGKMEKSLWYNKPFYSYRGIPYAKPPVGELRFKAPEPVEKWTNPIDAFEFKPRSAQKSGFILSTCEDSLFLNVFVPVLEERKKLPIVFFIHGGFFTGGHDIFGPDHFMEHEIILVSVSFRMTVFGYMSLGTPEYSGNMALKDQQLAMKWTYENIEAFGGDNQQITLLGISSGGNCVGAHLINEESSKYFNQVICGGGTPNKPHNYRKEDHRCLIQQFYNKFFEGQPSDAQLINFLKEVDVSEVLNFFENEKGVPVPMDLPWTIMIESPNAIRPFLVDDPMTAIGKMKTIDKPALYTTAQYEMLCRFFITNEFKDPNLIRKYINDSHFLLPIYGYKTINDRQPKYLENVMKKIKDFYFNVTELTSDQDLLMQRIVLDSDLYYIYSIEKWIEQHVAISNKDTFYLRFSFHTKVNPHPEYPGCGHCDENLCIFRHKFSEDKKIKENMETDEECAFAFHVMNLLQKLYSNFIKYGKPVLNDDQLLAQECLPIKRSSKSDEFDFVDVTNSGLFQCRSPANGRVQFLDGIIDEVKQLIKENGDENNKAN